MPEVFLISDTHFGHQNVLGFEHDGKPLRSFNTLADHDFHMVDRWNSVVTSNDKVYHLGDVAWGKDAIKIMHMLNGRKRLIRGNHDILKTRVYLEYFQEIYGVRQINGVWLTHVPMHPFSAHNKRVKINAHGHLHANVIDDPKYFNVSVERINYTPISIDELPIPEEK